MSWFCKIGGEGGRDELYMMKEMDTSALTPAFYCENAVGRENYARADALATPGEGTRPTGARHFISGGEQRFMATPSGRGRIVASRKVIRTLQWPDDPRFMRDRSLAEEGRGRGRSSWGVHLGWHSSSFYPRGRASRVFDVCKLLVIRDLQKRTQKTPKNPKDGSGVGVSASRPWGVRLWRSPTAALLSVKPRWVGKSNRRAVLCPPCGS